MWFLSFNGEKSTWKAFCMNVSVHFALVSKYCKVSNTCARTYMCNTRVVSITLSLHLNGYNHGNQCLRLEQRISTFQIPMCFIIAYCYPGKVISVLVLVHFQHVSLMSVMKLCIRNNMRCVICLLQCHGWQHDG